MASACEVDMSNTEPLASHAPSSPTLSGGGIRGLWDSHLRSTRPAPSTPSPRRNLRIHVTGLPKTVESPCSSDSVSVTPNGLTNSARRSRSASLSSMKRTMATMSRSPNSRSSSARRTENSVTVQAADDSLLARPLFPKTCLLQELEPHDAAPALTVVLDLDETLVSNRNQHLPCAVLRPYCLHVLNALRHMKNLEIVLWTASTKETAAPVVEQLHESGLIFDDIIYRNRMWFTEPVHTKDLRLLGRDLDRVVIVDNAANCCKFNPRNAILVDDFHGFRHEEDATLINVYYMVESLLKQATEGVAVRDGLQRLVEEGHLCRGVFYPLPDAWKSLPLSEIAPIKIPPCGRFVRSNGGPPSRSIMKYWTY